MHVLVLLAACSVREPDPPSASPSEEDTVPEAGMTAGPACDGPMVAAWKDADGDGHGAGTRMLVCAGSPGYSSRGDDCDDADSATYPEAPEACNDGHFENCNRGTPCRYDRDAALENAGVIVTGDWLTTGIVAPGDVDRDGRADVGVGSCQRVEDDFSCLVSMFLGSRQTGTVAYDAAYAVVPVSKCGPVAAIPGSDGESGALIVVAGEHDTDTSPALGWPFPSSLEGAIATLPAFKRLNWPFLAGTGDVDGDGFSDIVAGDPIYNDAGDVINGHDDGRVWLFGGPLHGEIALDDARTIIVGGDNQRLGERVHRVGDLDGDGLADVAALENLGNGSDFLLFEAPPAGVIGSDAYATRIRGAYGAVGDDANGGDANGDGYDDLLLSGTTDGITTTAWYLQGPLAARDLDPSTASTAIFTTADADDGVDGVGVALPGDMDGDGQGEIVLGYSRACRLDYAYCPGVTAIFYGPVSGTHDWREADGLVWGTGDGAGSAGHVESIGDFDGDGLADLLLGGWLSWNGAPRAYVLLGANP